MVITARLDTNIRKIVRDSVDRAHGVKYEGTSVLVKGYCEGGGHNLNISTGELVLGNIQTPERPVVVALADYHEFNDNKFNPMTVPTWMNFYLFPTLFELERLALEPIVIGNLTVLASDGVSYFEENSYFKEQKAQLEAFCAAYARAVDTSSLGKPVVVGFYEAMRRKNIQYLQDAENPGRTEAMKRAIRRCLYPEEDFVSAFGRDICAQLKSLYGLPKFR